LTPSSQVIEALWFVIHVRVKCPYILGDRRECVAKPQPAVASHRLTMRQSNDSASAL